jgi:hypothetical protein
MDKRKVFFYLEKNIEPPKLLSPVLTGASDVGIISAFYSTPVLDIKLGYYFPTAFFKKN